MGLLAGPGLADAESLIDRWNLGPKYRSSYKVNKELRTWTQNANLDRKIRGLDLKSLLKTSNKRNPAQNDLEQTGGELKLDFTRRSGSFSFFSKNHLRRDLLDTSRQRRSIDTDRFDIGTTLKLISRDEGSLAFTFEGGRTLERRLDENVRPNGLITDRTRNEGWNGGLSFDSALKPSESFEFEAGVSYERSSSDSRTVGTDETDDEVTTSEEAYTDNDHSLDYDIKGTWKRYRSLELELSARATDATDQYYQASLRSQETRRTIRRNFRLAAGGDIGQNFGYDGSVELKAASKDFKLSTTDNDDADVSYGLDAFYKPQLPLLAGTEIRAGAAFSVANRERQRTTPYDKEKTDLGADITRTFFENLKLRAKLEEDLQQTFYGDGSQDEDRHEVRATYSGTYSWSEGSRASASYTTKTQETIKIPEEKAAQSQRKEDYSIRANYSTGLPAGIDLSQDLTVSARYTYYIFDEERNTLSRINRVVTNIDIPFGERTHMDVQHDVKLSDSGKYTYTEGSVSRSYEPSSERIRQYMKVVLDVEVSSLISIAATEIYEINTTTRLSSGSTTRQEKSSFTGEMRLRKTFDSGFSVSARFSRWLTTTDDDYWVIDATAEMAF